MKTKINFNPILFNPNFWHLDELFNNKEIRHIWLIGGSSSSKTYSTVQAILKHTLQDSQDTIVFRKQNNSIERTVWKDFKTVLDTWNLNELFKTVKSPFQIRCINGAVIDFGGMDDPEKIKGISQYKRVYCNEMSAFEHNDHKQIRKRLRGKEGQQIISDLNPIDELHWIKTDILDKETQNPLPTSLNNGVVDPILTEITEKWINNPQEIVNPTTKQKEIIPPNMVVLRSTYLNNYWIVGSPDKRFGFYDIHTIADFEKDKLNDYNFYRIYALGEWGKVNIGGEFYKAFRTDEHIQSAIPYDEDLPLHISFDENVNPYLSLSIYQGVGLKTWKIDEICLKHPNNTLGHTLTEFKRRYPENKNGLFIYGDATSKKADAKLEKGQNFFTIIQMNLLSYNPVMRVPASNPPVAMRGNFINDIFRGKIEGVEYTVSDNCKNSIVDYQYTKEASDGTKLKEKAKDPVTKVTYEKFGHLTDTDDYFICEYYKNEFAEYQRGPIARPIIKRRNRGTF